MYKKSITLGPISKINGNINLPGSKSISNRVLLLAAQATGTTKLINLLNSDDVNYMLFALKQLGIKYYFSHKENFCEIYGIGKSLKSNSFLELFLGNAGTVMRPLTAALCLQSHKIILTGEPRMKKRPIGHLVNALRQGGAHIEYLEQNNYPPILISGGYYGGKIIIKGSISSQFLTSLLMMAPLAKNDSTIVIDGNLVSKPYIDMTIKLMKIFGIEVHHKNYQIFYLKSNSKYSSPGKYLIEGDASSASYFLAAAAIKGGTVKVFGIGKNSIQGDVSFANVLKKMGASIHIHDNYIECTNKGKLNSINMDFNNIPDAAMTIAVVALFSDGITILRNIYNWRVKETDRLKAMATELRKLGAGIIEGYDYLIINPPKFLLNNVIIDTYNDHRIAMSFSLAALSTVSVTINNPKCTNKTFPGFFEELLKLVY